MKNKILIVFLFSCMFYLTHAQSTQRVNETGTPYFISFDSSSNAIAAKSNTNTSLTSLEALQKYLNLQENDEFRIISNSTDDLGYNHQKYQQYYKGIKVDFATFYVHYKNGKVHAMNGDYQPVSNINATPTLSENQALNNALNHVNAQQYIWEEILSSASRPKAEIVIVPISSEKNSEIKLAYKFRIKAINPDYHADVYVDAHSGLIVYEHSNVLYCSSDEDQYSNKNIAPNYNIQTKNSTTTTPTPFEIGTGHTVYRGMQPIISHKTTSSLASSNGFKYELWDPVRDIETVTHNSIWNTIDFPSSYLSDTKDWFLKSSDFFPLYNDDDRAALDAHWGAVKVYDYFKTKHNWLGLNDNKDNTDLDKHMPIRIVITNKAKVAKIDGDGGFVRIILSSTGLEPERPMSALDIVAHEFTHGITRNSADFSRNARKEACALDEGIADIMGFLVEHTYYPGEENWVFGDLLFATREDDNENIRGARNIKDPKNTIGRPGKKFPDTYEGTFWASTGRICHKNSTIMSHWFYILSEGKSGTNDTGFSYNVSPIGIDKAAKIIFRTLTNYMTTNTDFRGARVLSTRAASDLYGVESSEVRAVIDAWNAVGVYDNFNVSSPTLNQTLIAGEPHQISWTKVEGLDQVDIKLSTDGGNTYPITLASNINNNGTYNITIPANTSGDRNKIKVIAKNNRAKSVMQGYSPIFNIALCPTNPFPYTLDFENGLKNWTTHYIDVNQSSPTDISYEEWQITTRSLNRFGPQTPNQGRHYLQSRVTEGESYFTSPTLNISQNNLKLWFNFYLDQDLSESDPIFVPLPKTPSNFKVEITTDNGATWNTELDLKAHRHNSNFWFTNYTIDLAKYYGSCVKIRFSNTGALSQRNPFGLFTIDDIKIRSSNQAKATIRQDQISINSNPVKNKLDLTLPENIQQYTYTIIGVTGAEITTGTSNKKELIIDASSLSKGMYFISIKGATINDGIRFIKK